MLIWSLLETFVVFVVARSFCISTGTHLKKEVKRHAAEYLEKRSVPEIEYELEQARLKKHALFWHDSVQSIETILIHLFAATIVYVIYLSIHH